jgi:hypothetical protein
MSSTHFNPSSHPSASLHSDTLLYPENNIVKEHGGTLSHPKGILSQSEDILLLQEDGTLPRHLSTVTMAELPPNFQPLTEFQLFPALPAELRLKIYSFILSRRPRIVEISHDDRGAGCQMQPPQPPTRPRSCQSFSIILTVILILES